MSTTEEKKIETDAEAMVRVQAELKDAAEKLQKLKDKAAGRTRMSRDAWDALTNAQQELLADGVVRGLVVIEDSIQEEEISGTIN
jgi:hypothetical protein